MLEHWAAVTPRRFRFAIKASRRITHDARLKADAAADSLAYLYRNLAALGDKRGPVLFQLPPFLKKDLPRLRDFLQLLPAGPSRRVRVPQRELVRRRRLRALARRRRRAVPVRARGQRAAAAGRDRALGLSCGCASRATPMTISRSGPRGSPPPAGSETYVYFMHEPTAPGYARRLAQLASAGEPGSR